jgi:hypothetical protein
MHAFTRQNTGRFLQVFVAAVGGLIVAAFAVRISVADPPPVLAHESPAPPAAKQRPVVSAVLVGGHRIEGVLERFDDGEYWILAGGELRKFFEKDLESIEFRVPTAAGAPTAEDRKIEELLAQFFRQTRDAEGIPQGVNPALTPKLAAVGQKLVRPLLAAFEKRGSEDYQEVGLVLKQMGPEVFPLLVECVREDPGRSARFPVWYAIRESGVQHAAFVQGLLKDKDPRIRLLAMEVLYSWSTASGTALPKSLDLPLIQVLDDPEEDVRSQTPLILGRIGFNSELVLPALLRTMEEDRYAEIRSNTVIALGYLGRDLKEGDPDLARIVAVLAKAVTDDPGEGIRHYSAFYLGEIGPKAAAALPALQRATDDKKELVRDKAEEAVKKVEGSVETKSKSKSKSKRS